MADLTISNTGETNIDRHTETIPKMVTVGELAELTGISEYAIRRLVKTNQIVYFRSGTKYLINFDRFIAFLNGEQ